MYVNIFNQVNMLSIYNIDIILRYQRVNTKKNFVFYKSIKKSIELHQ